MFLPTHGSLDIPDARLVVPGEPARSVLLERMLTSDKTLRMPPDGLRVDEDGIRRLECLGFRIKRLP